ncbi:MAG TPA: transglutaminase domain-containing protein [Candidatus Obscuribacterales bacterium]
MMRLLLWPLRLLLYALILLLPLLSFWLVSSLPLFLSGPKWLPWLAAFLVFPGLGLFWELESLVYTLLVSKRATDDKAVKAVKKGFGFADRVMLNTLILNGLILGTLLGVYPQESFTALSTRGDWFLAGRSEPWAEAGRVQMLRFANSLEAFYNDALDNPASALAQAAKSLQSLPLGHTRPAAAGGLAHTGKTGKAAKAAKTQPPAWPQPTRLHPAVASMPATAETDIPAVARYLAQRESDPYGRVKAVYDYVASRITYDGAALKQGVYPPQDPVTVFKTRKAVCAGYSRLFMALTGEMGLLSAYVTGDARDINGTVPPGVGHAWNAVKIRGKWYLIDSTWGSGYLENFRFHRRYTPAYLFTPPEVFGQDHFPEATTWQLRRQPLSRRAFETQPMLRAGFFARGYRLAEPVTSPLQAQKQLHLTLHNPKRQYLLAHLQPEKGKTTIPCRITGTRTLRLSCPIPSSGPYQLELFSNSRSYGSFESIGQIKVEGS